MYNTDRVSGYEDAGAVIFEEANGFELKGKEWAQGYKGYRPHTVYNMGTNNGKHGWDIRVFIKVFRDCFGGWERFEWYKDGNTHPATFRVAGGYKGPDPRT